MPDPAAIPSAETAESGGLTSLIIGLAREASSGHSLSPPSAVPTSGMVAPPVHPTFDPLESGPKDAPKEKAIPALDPGSGKESYAFGEPHRYFDRKDLTSSGQKTAPLPGSSGQEYYFIREPAPQAGKNASSPGLAGFDVQGVRKDFPALHQKVNGHPLIWLDNAATTHKPQAVLDATSSFYGRDNSNIHRAAHALAGRSTQLFEAGREKVRKFIGAGDSKEIVFLRGTTEAVNLVAQSYGRKNIGPGDEILITTMEHHANIVPWQLLAEQTGAVLRVAPINEKGELKLDQFASLLGNRTKIVSVAHVSNALGTVNPVEQVIAMAHAFGVPVLVDGAQSSPHMPINVQALDADFFAFSGHKVFGPTGIGVLYGKSHLLEQMPPWQGGGHMIKDVTINKTVYQGHPEKFEAGTPDIAGVVGLGAAIDYLEGIGMPAIAAYEHALLEYATTALATVPGIRPIGTAANKASVLSFVIPGITNESIAKHLDKHGIAVRAGHHCAMPALRSFGLETTVRPSLAFYNTREEVDTLVKTLHRLPELKEIKE